jgi:hypothetical protein
LKSSAASTEFFGKDRIHIDAEWGVGNAARRTGRILQSIFVVFVAFA